MGYDFSEDHEQIVFLEEEVVTKEPVQMNGGSYQRISNCWWFVHPEKGLVMWRRGDGIIVPQCNPVEEIAKEMVKEFFPRWAEVRFYKDVWIRDDL